MTTYSETIDRSGGEHGSFAGMAGEFLRLLFAPLVGLAFVAVYGLVGTGVALCLGLRALGIKCGFVRN